MRQNDLTQPETHFAFGKNWPSYYHDVHDWLGGWPYESISPHEVDEWMSALGFVTERVQARRRRWWERAKELFGSGCDEYVYRRLNTA